MYLSRTGFRITAYHMVIASRVPWIGNQGGGGFDPRSRHAGLVELPQGGDLTGVGVDEERGHDAPG
jgi:hypothetical protein